MQLRWSGHLMRMDDERLAKRLFYGDVVTGSHRQGGQIRRHKGTLKSSLKRLQINTTNWEEPALDRQTWRRTVKTGSAIHEANRIASAKAKRETSPLQPPTPEVSSRTASGLTATAPSHHASAWSITCESIAQRLANQCLEHQPTPTALTPTAHTALALSRTAWAYLATCAFTRAELTALPAHPPRQTPHSLHCPVRQPAPPQVTLTPPTSPAHTFHAHSPLASAWSVTCESIAQRLVNQCLERQPMPTTLDSSARTALALSGIVWAYSATCASKNTCGRQPPAAPHHQTLPPAPPPYHKHPTVTSHASGKCASRLGSHAASAARST
ncbi:hypothetical protein SprV_0902653700 [Sparganum proliferum]